MLVVRAIMLIVPLPMGLAPVEFLAAPVAAAGKRDARQRGSGPERG